MMGPGSVTTSSGPLRVNIGLKRTYESARAEDGKRILIDPLWPRGLSKTKAAALEEYLESRTRR